MLKPQSILFFLFFVSFFLPACRGAQPTYVRGSDVPGIDDPAMGVGLDRADLQEFFDQHIAALGDSRWLAHVNESNAYPGPTLAIMPMENQTTEHVEAQLNWYIGLVETEFVNSGHFTVVAQQLREQIMEELEIQQGEAFDQSRAVQVGRQLGVQYFVTGRVIDNSERTSSARRVQYTMIMQVLNVETGAIAWQNQVDLTKAIIPL